MTGDQKVYIKEKKKGDDRRKEINIESSLVTGVC
jgi:hypothetical protein